MNLLTDVTSARTEAAEQRRRDADADVERRAYAAKLALQLESARRESERQNRLATERARTEQEAAKAARRAAAKVRAAGAWQARRLTALKLGESALWVGPILAPMAVAWAGQVQFAQEILGWNLPSSIVFAAAFELTTAYVARLDWLSRQAGDSGAIFRAATWLFALIAAGMNYFHAAGPGLEPTGAAVAYGLMSLTGIALWELLSLYRHRKHLRDTGQRPAAVPQFGLGRWVNFPGVTWMARRLAIRDGHTTVDAAWSASTEYWARRASARAAKKEATRTSVKRDVGPADVAPAKRGPKADTPVSDGADRPADVAVPAASPANARRRTVKADVPDSKPPVRRPLTETRALAEEILASAPLTREQAAEVIGVSTRHLRRALNEPSGEQPTVAAKPAAGSASA